jgi:hypothetical protein
VVQYNGEIRRHLKKRAAIFAGVLVLVLAFIFAQAGAGTVTFSYARHGPLTIKIVIPFYPILVTASRLPS